LGIPKQKRGRCNSGVQARKFEQQEQCKECGAPKRKVADAVQVLRRASLYSKSSAGEVAWGYRSRKGADATQVFKLESSNSKSSAENAAHRSVKWLMQSRF
jgi:hypothetical protein